MFTTDYLLPPKSKTDDECKVCGSILDDPCILAIHRHDHHRDFKTVIIEIPEDADGKEKWEFDLLAEIDKILELSLGERPGEAFNVEAFYLDLYSWAILRKQASKASRLGKLRRLRSLIIRGRWYGLAEYKHGIANIPVFGLSPNPHLLSTYHFTRGLNKLVLSYSVTPIIPVDTDDAEPDTKVDLPPGALERMKETGAFGHGKEITNSTSP